MMKILVAEDDFVCQLLMREFLQALGALDIVFNGRMALEAATAALASDQPYDLICLDIMMPEMDGQAVLRAIRQAEAAHAAGARRAKIIMTTALADQQMIVQAFQAQCDGYLVKPFDRANVLDTLAQLGLVPPAPTP
jgi:two-component system chemotaxis response regulator CheY